jgi:GTP cyclohydrolase I
MVDTAIIKNIEFCYDGIVRAIQRLGYTSEEDNLNFINTPNRCARALVKDFIWSKQNVEESISSLLEATFVSQNDEMIIQNNIPVVTLCPHHLIPVEMRVSIGYLPNNRVIGLSKLARIAKVIGKQPILQETYTTQLSDALTPLKSKGTGVYVIGKHGCMSFRGVDVPEARTITSCLTGSFKEFSATREEFLASCRNHQF